MVISKEELRRKLREKRKSLESTEARRLSEDIANKLRELIKRTGARKVLLYSPVDGEPDISSLFPEIISEGKLLLPKVTGRNIIVCEIKDTSELKRGAFGILEPSECRSVDISEVELAAVPGIAFDREGYRLGFGKGFYDRLLQNSRAFKVGILYSFQLIDFIPRDPWDVPMDILITERETLDTKGGLLWKA